MTVPYTFANQTGNIALSELDANFANVKAAADTAGTVTASAQPVITSVGQLTSLTVSGNIRTLSGGVYAPGYYYANGQPFLPGSSTGSYGNSNVAAYLPTYTGALTSLTGNVSTTGYITSVGAIFAGPVTATGNIQGGNVVTNGMINASRTISGGNLVANGAVTGYTLEATVGGITAFGNIAGGNITTAGNVVATQRVQGSAFLTAGTVQGSDLYSTNLLRGANLIVSGPASVSGNLTVQGTLITAGPIFMANNATPQSLLSGATVLIFGNTAVNTNNYYNPTTGVFTPLVPGYYQVNVSFTPQLVAGTGVASFFAGLYKNGSLIAVGGSTTLTLTWGDISCSSISTLVYLNGSTDDLRIASLNTITSGTWQTGVAAGNFFQAVWVHA